jgi:hypothetical protein
MFGLVIVSALVCPAIGGVDASSAGMQMRPVTRCIQDRELSERLATLKLQGGTEVAKVNESLLSKARTSPECRTEIVQALVRAIKQASNTTNLNEKFFLWQSGAGLLADLKATEALDLLIANIDFTGGWSASLSQYHFPALAAVLKIGSPAIPKLQGVLRNDAEPHRRKFAAFCIAYIGGSEAQKVLSGALSGETDPCVKRFLQLSLQAFDNKANPNLLSLI